jgi:hypothetical protein
VICATPSVRPERASTRTSWSSNAVAPAPAARGWRARIQSVPAPASRSRAIGCRGFAPACPGAGRPNRERLASPVVRSTRSSSPSSFAVHAAPPPVARSRGRAPTWYRAATAPLWGSTRARTSASTVTQIASPPTAACDGLSSSGEGSASSPPHPARMAPARRTTRRSRPGGSPA